MRASESSDTDLKAIWDDDSLCTVSFNVLWASTNYGIEAQDWCVQFTGDVDFATHGAHGSPPRPRTIILVLVRVFVAESLSKINGSAGSVRYELDSAVGMSFLFVSK